MENRKPTINVSELRAIVGLIFDHIENELGVSEIELSENYYWNISDESLYEVGQEMDEPSIGSLIDDLEFLKPLLEEREQAFPLMLVHVAPLLRFIATKGPTTAP